MTSPRRSRRWSTGAYALTLAVLAVTAAGLAGFNVYAGVATGGYTAMGIGGTLVLVLWCLLPFTAMVAATVTAYRSSPRALPVLLAGSLVLMYPAVATSTSYFDQPLADRNAMGGVFVSVALWLVVIATVAAAAGVGAVSQRRSPAPVH